MAVTTTQRFGLTQWSANTDPYRRTHVNQSFANLEARAAGYEHGVGVPPAGPEYEGFFFFDTSVSSLYYCDGNQWWFLVGAQGGFDSPDPLKFSTLTSDSGVATKAARADHEHPMPGFAAPVAVGTSVSAGSGETVARASHVHIVGAGAINDSSIMGAESVTITALAPNSVTSAKLASQSVSGAKLANNSIATSNLQNLSVTQVKLADGAVDGSGLGSIDASKVTTGVFDPARFPTNIDATKIASGVLDSARLPVSTYIPPGVIMPHSSTTAPQTAGTWLPCDGSAVSRTTYAQLNSVLAAAGYPYGAGDGSSTFNVPDLTASYPLVKSTSGTGSTLGETGGDYVHSHTGQPHTHTIDPPNVTTSSTGNHQHTLSQGMVSDGAHSHNLGNTGSHSVGTEYAFNSTPGLVSKNDISHSHSHSHGAGDTGGDYDAASSSGHTHNVDNSLATSSPSYTPSRAHQHIHSNPDLQNNLNHVHGLYPTGFNGVHDHDLDIEAFASSDGSALGATGATSGNLPPLLAFAFFIKT